MAKIDPEVIDAVEGHLRELYTDGRQAVSVPKFARAHDVDHKTLLANPDSFPLISKFGKRRVVTYANAVAWVLNGMEATNR